MSEKRFFERFPHSEPIHLQFKDPRVSTGCLARDLSEGGVRVRLNDFIPLNTELVAEVRLRDENIVESSARVVWVEKSRFGDYYQAGLEFSGSDLAVMNQKKIEEFLVNVR